MMTKYMVMMMIETILQSWIHSNQPDQKILIAWLLKYSSSGLFLLRKWVKQWPGIASLFTQFSKWSVWALVLLLSKVWSEFTHVRSQHLMSTTTKLCLTWIPPRNMHYKAEAFVQLQLSWLNFDHTFTLLSTDWFPCSHATDPFSLCMLSLFLVHKNPSYIGKFENEILSLSTQLFLGSQISASAKFSKLNPLQIIALKS